MNVALRAKAMLVDPVAEWARIERESGDPAYLLSRYVAWLALIPVLSGFIGAGLIGAQVPGSGTVRAPIVDALFGVVFGYVETFAVVLLLGLIINLMAPLFSGERSFDSALKLVVYSYTPVWLAGIFLLLPGLRFLVLTGFYSVYVLSTGLSRLMKSAEQNTVTYVLIIAVWACALTYAAAAAQRIVFGTPGF